jgi:flagellar biosynthesis/type III secretory pathway chaperone
MTLLPLLGEELAAVTELERLLLREYEILQARDPAALEQVVTAKQTCIERLRQLIVHRLDYFRAQGIEPNAQGLAAHLETLPSLERDEANQIWSVLEQRVEQVRAQNDVNGTVIAASRNRIDRTLAILHGRDALEFLYDHDTRKIFGGASQPIAKA